MNKETEKIKCHQEKNTSGYGVKQEMTDEKIQKKPKILFAFHAAILFLNYFRFFGSWKLNLILTYIDSDSYEKG